MGQAVVFQNNGAISLGEEPVDSFGHISPQTEILLGEPAMYFAGPIDATDNRARGCTSCGVRLNMRPRSISNDKQLWRARRADGRENLHGLLRPIENDEGNRS